MEHLPFLLDDCWEAAHNISDDIETTSAYHATLLVRAHRHARCAPTVVTEQRGDTHAVPSMWEYGDSALCAPMGARLSVESVGRVSLPLSSLRPAVQTFPAVVARPPAPPRWQPLL